MHAPAPTAPETHTPLALLCTQMSSLGHPSMTTSYMADSLPLVSYYKI